MSEKTPEEIAAEEAANAKSQLDELQAKLDAAEKRASEAANKFEMTKKERSEEREKRQKEAEKNQQYEEAKKLQDEKLAEMQAEIEKHKIALAEAEGLKDQASKWAEYQDKRRTALLESIPEANREAYKTAPLELLETTVEILNAHEDKGGSHRGPAHKPNPANGGTKWADMTDGERSEKAKILDVGELAKLISG